MNASPEHSAGVFLPLAVANAWRGALDELVADLTARGIDPVCVAEFLMAYGALTALPISGPVATAERMRDFADVVERGALAATSPAGRA